MKTAETRQPSGGRSPIILSLATFCSLGLLGLLFSSIGTAFPAIRTAFGIGIGQAALLSVVVQLGYALFCFLGGVLTDAFDRRRILVAGAVGYAVLAFGTGWPASFGGNLALFVGLGVSCGVVFIGSNTLVVELFPDRRSAALNLHHLFFAIGSLAGPLIAGTLISAGYPWQLPFRLLGGWGVFIAGVLWFSARRRDSAPRRRALWSARLAQYRDAIRDRLFLHLLGIGVLSIGVQFVIIYLLVTFLMDARGMPLPAAGAILSGYFACLALGRLGCSRLVRYYSTTGVIAFLLLLLVAFFALAWLTTGTVSLVFWILTGFACSGLMPSMLALGATVLPQRVVGSALGLLAMCGGLGGMLLTYVTSFFAERIGMSLAFGLNLGIAIAAAVWFLLFRSRYATVEAEMLNATQQAS